MQDARRAIEKDAAVRAQRDRLNALARELEQQIAACRPRWGMLGRALARTVGAPRTYRVLRRQPSDAAWQLAGALEWQLRVGMLPCHLRHVAELRVAASRTMLPVLVRGLRRAHPGAATTHWIIHGSRAELAMHGVIRAVARSAARCRVTTVVGGAEAALAVACAATGGDDNGTVLVSRPVFPIGSGWLDRLTSELRATGAAAVAPVVRDGTGRQVDGAWKLDDGRLRPVTSMGDVAMIGGSCVLMRGSVASRVPRPLLRDGLWAADFSLVLRRDGHGVRQAPVAVAAARGTRHGDLTTLQARHRRRRPDRPLSFALRIGARTDAEARRGGDVELARALAKALRRRGHPTTVELVTDQPSTASLAADVLVEIRGRHPRPRQPSQLGVTWLISHPTEVDDEELGEADLVLVASDAYAAQLGERLRTPVLPLLQFTDPDRFRRPAARGPVHPVLFVGNAYAGFRDCVWDAFSVGVRPALYGRGWRYLAPDHVVAEWVPNDQLHRLYASAEIVLCDHWPDMRKRGFLSNRIFDVLASEGFALSDPVTGVESAFDGVVATYRDPEHLREQVEAWHADEPSRRARGRQGRALVLERHSADIRAGQLLDALRFARRPVGRESAEAVWELIRATPEALRAPPSRPGTGVST